MVMNPENMRPLKDVVLTRRMKPSVKATRDPLTGGTLNLSVEAETASGLVIPGLSSDITRAVVIASGPDAGLEPGTVVGIPGRSQGTPAMREVDSDGETWEGWRKSQIIYRADWVKVKVD